MKKLLALLALMPALTDAAGTTATVTWTPPSTFTDGRPLTSGAVTGYRIDATPKSGQGSTLTLSVAANVTTKAFAGLMCGDWDFTVVTLGPVNSDPSNTAAYATGVACSNKPNPPAAVTAN